MLTSSLSSVWKSNEYAQSRINRSTYDTEVVFINSLLSALCTCVTVNFDRSLILVLKREQEKNALRPINTKW